MFTATLIEELLLTAALFLQYTTYPYFVTFGNAKPDSGNVALAIPFI
ncbi:hypothetical protein ACSQ6I_14285 [Anabaena sp. WFMT]